LSALRRRIWCNVARCRLAGRDARVYAARHRSSIRQGGPHMERQIVNPWTWQDNFGFV